MRIHCGPGTTDMKEIVIISGKGGTGKTSLTAALASIAEKVILADCDVDAADLHLIAKPASILSNDFIGGRKASVIRENCVSCGRCAKKCSFDAISMTGEANDLVQKTYYVDETACEGCGVCRYYCPAEAISFDSVVNGQWFISETRFGLMVHARLKPGEENSGKLVTVIRKEAKNLADKKQAELILVDGSPGIGCPVTASVTGADLALIVTEPTVSGMSDYIRAARLTKQFKIPTAVCINKCDLNTDVAQKIEDYANENDMTVVGAIPYEPAFTEAQIEGKTIIEYCGNGIAAGVENIWQKLIALL